MTITTVSQVLAQQRLKELYGDLRQRTDKEWGG
jgi:hypothetical protein